MTQQLILKGNDVRDLFMAALLKCTKKFEGAKVRLVSEEEDASAVVNVNPDMIRENCPSWASSELICILIRCKVCAPIIDNHSLDIEQKVDMIKKSLIIHAEKQGIELPA